MKDWYLIKSYVDEDWIFHVQFKNIKREITVQEYADLNKYLTNYTPSSSNYIAYSFKEDTPDYIKHYLIKAFLYENKSEYEYEELIKMYQARIKIIKELRKILDHEYAN